MSKKKKDAGFNTPFSGLKQLQREPAKGRAPPRPAAKPAAEESDRELFLRAVGGAAPVAPRKERVEPDKREQRTGPSDDELALSELHSFVKGEGPFALTDTEEQQSGAAPGVSHELVTALERGDFAFRRHLDLHGFTRDEAHGRLGEFVRAARHDGERCVLVITGRGKSSPTGTSVLKETLPRWLSRKPLAQHVLAFCTARPVHGGPGAFYVLLRRAGVRPFGTAE